MDEDEEEEDVAAAFMEAKLKCNESQTDTIDLLSKMASWRFNDQRCELPRRSTMTSLKEREVSVEEMGSRGSSLHERVSLGTGDTPVKRGVFRGRWRPSRKPKREGSPLLKRSKSRGVSLGVACHSINHAKGISSLL